MPPTGHAKIDARGEPSQGMFCSREGDVVLKNMIEVDVPPTAAVEHRDWPSTVDVRPKLLICGLLRDLHSAAS
jgi:hypothetical protein